MNQKLFTWGVIHTVREQNGIKYLALGSFGERLSTRWPVVPLHKLCVWKYRHIDVFIRSRLRFKRSVILETRTFDTHQMASYRFALVTKRIYAMEYDATTGNQKLWETERIWQKNHVALNLKKKFAWDFDPSFFWFFFPLVFYSNATKWCVVCEGTKVSVIEFSITFQADLSIKLAVAGGNRDIKLNVYFFVVYFSRDRQTKPRMTLTLSFSTTTRWSGSY